MATKNDLISGKDEQKTYKNDFISGKDEQETFLKVEPWSNLRMETSWNDKYLEGEIVLDKASTYVREFIIEHSEEKEERKVLKDQAHFLFSIEKSMHGLPGYATLNYLHVREIFEFKEQIKKYVQETANIRPMNWLLLASPGEGKSHFIKCIADQIRSEELKVQAVTFNMATMRNSEDLASALDEARNAKVDDNVPLLFLDEFDNDPKNYGLLLPLLWDGELELGARKLKLGRAIIVLAGSGENLSEMMDKVRNIKEDTEEIKDEAANQKANKLPDLISRINGGVVEIPSLTIRKKGKYRLEDKICIAVAVLRREFKNFMWVPASLLRFINEVEFRYGVRSIQRLIGMIRDSKEGLQTKDTEPLDQEKKDKLDARRKALAVRKEHLAAREKKLDARRTGLQTNEIESETNEIESERRAIKLVHRQIELDSGKIELYVGSKSDPILVFPEKVLYINRLNTIFSNENVIEKDGIASHLHNILGAVEIKEIWKRAAVDKRYVPINCEAFKRDRFDSPIKWDHDSSGRFTYTMVRELGGEVLDDKGYLDLTAFAGVEPLHITKLSLSEEKGEWFHGGKRHIFFNINTLRQILGGVKANDAKSLRELGINMGSAFGSNFVQFLSEEELIGTIEKMIEYWCHFDVSGGWGKWIPPEPENIEIADKSGEIKIINNFLAAKEMEVENPKTHRYCLIMEGYIEAVLREFMKILKPENMTEISVKEESCEQLTPENDFCLFSYKIESFKPVEIPTAIQGSK
jgi:predicted AAA+ superfamily ATPase